MRGRVVAGIAVALLGATSAHAQEPLTPDQRAQFAFESSVIGPGHAREHLRQEQVEPVPTAPEDQPFDPCRPRGPAIQYEARPLPPEGKPTGQARCSPLPPQPRGAQRARDGMWTRTVIDLPHYAIHSALLPTGKVLFYGFEWTQRLITRQGGSHQQTPSVATLWDPRTGRMTSVPPPQIDVDGDGIPEPVPLYCSGQSFLPDGRLLVTGGTLDLRWAERGYTNPPGIKVTLVFDPRTEDWVRGPDMSTARWYPTQVRLPDGRTLVLGGYDDQKPTSLTGVLEAVSPDGRTITHLARGDRVTWTYPGLALLPSARVLLAGPRKEDTGLWDPDVGAWSPVAPLPEVRGGENVVPIPTRTGTSPRVMLIGGADFLAGGNPSAWRTTRVFDDRRPQDGWRKAPPQRRPRNWPNTVLLPDGSMATFGGGTAIGPRDGAYTSDGQNRRVELWSPATKRWRLGPAQREDRTYHSVALLLPDGRVWSAGDDANPNRDGDTAEVYAPPYLFRGARPKLTAAPAVVRPRTRFTVTVDQASVDRVTLVAPSTVTHALDMGQRFVELRVVGRVGRKLTVEGPKDLAAATPGPYMLFAVNAKGVPSVARWVRVRR